MCGFDKADRVLYGEQPEIVDNLGKICNLFGILACKAYVYQVE